MELVALDWFLNHVFRTWWLEPVLATVSFTLCIHAYWWLEHQENKTRSLRAPILDAFSTRAEFGPLRQSFLGYWVGILLWIRVVPPASQQIPDGWPSQSIEGLYLAAEVVSGIILYDAVFFILHWAMHSFQCLQRFHKHHHHYHHTVEAQDVLHHSLVDGTLQVLVNILVQRHTVWGSVKTRWARSLHNVIVIWMLTESHSAAEHVRPWSWMLRGVRDHRRVHHMQHEPRYQQFLAYLDNGREAWAQWRRRQEEQLRKRTTEVDGKICYSYDRLK